jgi:Ca2+-binding RTX toxin-like protein
MRGADTSSILSLSPEHDRTILGEFTVMGLRSRSHESVGLAAVLSLAALLFLAISMPETALAGKPAPACIVSAGVTISRNTITGTPGDDTIDCRGAKKGYTIFGKGSDNTLGGDQIWGGNAADVIWATDPGATCVAPWPSVYVRGGGGNDIIHGAPCITSGEGGPGNDLFIAEGGCNSFSGDAGDDTIDLTKAALPPIASCIASASGGAGNDHIIAAAAWGTLAYGDDGNDVMDGGSGDDWFLGGPGDDSLNGNGGVDRLEGEQGIDQLSGGDGDDFLVDDGLGDADFFDGGLNDTVPNGSIPFPDGYGGDRCFDQDGRGTAPDYPDGSPATGLYSAVQNDSMSGCEVLYVTPAAP